MKEISLHILDLVENSIKAHSSLIKVEVFEDVINDTFVVEIDDNGIGMEEEFLKKVDNPFVTSRTTRNVGLGISLLKAAALRCDGKFNIYSKKNVGTKVWVSFKHSHIDRAPLGNMGETIVTIINNQSDFELVYTHKHNDKEFIFDTRVVKDVLKGADIRNGNILLWIKEYVNNNIKDFNKYK